MFSRSITGAACACFAVISFNTSAALTTFINDQAGWLAQIGGAGAITGTEDFNSFGVDVSVHNTTLNLPLLSITASSANPSFNKIDVPPFFNVQADQDGTPSFLGYQNVTIDFAQNLTALEFGYLDAGGLSQVYSLQVNFVGGGSSTFSLGIHDPEVPIGLAADGGTLIDSITWVLSPTASPFSVDNIRLSAVPVPAAVWLFGSGLIGLIGVARRKKA
jgi:hypothetical protein